MTLQSDYLSLKRFLPKTTLNANVNIWCVEMSDFNMIFKFIKGVKTTLADTLSKLINLEINEINLPEREDFEYRYAMFEQLQIVYVDSSKHEPALFVKLSSIDATYDNVIEELTEGQNNDTFCTAIVQVINDRKMPHDKYFISDNGLLYEVVTEDDKLFYALVVFLSLSKYILHQLHYASGHNGTTITCQYLKRLYYWKGLCKDVNAHPKQFIK